MESKIQILALTILMFIAEGLSIAIRPTLRIADIRPPVSLDSIIPEHFGDWREVKQNIQHIVNPQEQLILNMLYSQTLSKTFVNSSGYQVMLSIAYGGDQSRDMGVHRPEVCYSAQGFQLSNQEKIQLQINGTQIPAMRLQTKLGLRTEPVTYWIRVGEKIVRGNLELGFARLSYGLKGEIADGLLFRVSSIDKDSSKAFEKQEYFIRELEKEIINKDKGTIFGEM